MKICVVCGKPFNCPPSSEKVCCSRECSHILRERRIKAGIYTDSIHRANRLTRLNPKMQRGTENRNAKAWRIKSPDGTVYECYNLLDWLRRHAYMLDGTPQQAWDGIAKMKYSMQGKRKHPSSQWKGWNLLAWGDDRNQTKIKK